MSKHILGRIQVTRECNQECVFCAAPPSKKERSFDEIKDKILELQKHGTTDLMLTGGEPTTRKDIIDILKFATGKFNEITIQTNATKLTEELLQKIIDLKSNIRFNTSFHTSDRGIYKKISGHDNLDAVIRGHRLIGEMGLWGYPTVVISSLNMKQLAEHFRFIKDNFDYMYHISINYIDPTCMARTNSWTVPKYCDAELYIRNAVKVLMDNKMSFRIERLPLCYMPGFEEFSSDIRRDIFDESRMMSFMKTENDDIKDSFFIEKRSNFTYAEQCSHCFYKQICPGINPRYVELYGDSEVFPVFDDPGVIVERVKNSRN